ncbi:putative protein CASC5 [Scophthalmus maximus]|uniref:Nudix hydrolase domain-containing protein n=1 Tax=Scophthalmus maximus TaxID=52904 RepID=A0A2U9CUG7_SCOMX|nr:putative protein CASC5 [Scophthalmus maximus]
MEPQEFAKNDESGGFSKRRISSILKAPRKSARFPDPEQQENVKVESCVKPVEKRNSRRVSFAPANDVLLFSKDVKNTSPGRSPLQELMTASATTQNRIPAAVAEDGIQQLKAMETLLNAPLHACKQDTVNFETVEGFGEKTVVFSTDDAFMDMTHSHSINFATYADISLHNCDALPTGREKTVVFAADDASMDLTLNHTINTANKDLSVEKRNVSSSVPSVDPGFENFLASLFKPGGPHSSSTAETSSSLAHIKTQKTERVDKENWLPTSVSAAMDKSVGEFRKTGQSSHGSALCPEEDVSMNLTEVHTGRILGVNEDENPFHFLFPTQDMYAQADKRLSQTAEMGKSKSDHKAAATTENRVQKVNIEYRSGPVNFDARDERTEKTIMFSADDEFMDMTQSHTVNIARGPLAPQQESAGGLDLGFKNFLTGLSKPTGPGVKPVIERMLPSAAASSKETITTSSSSSQLKTSKADPGKDNRSPNTSRRFGQSSTAGGICPEVDVGMDLTEAQTGRIIGIAGSDDPFQFLFHTQDLYPHGRGLNKTEKTSGQKNSEALGSSNRTGMGSSLKPSLKTKLQSHQDHFDPEDDHREKTVRFSADDACMDVTRSYTVNIGNDLKLLSCRDKTMRFNVDDAGMDMTQCLTVNIANNLGSESILPVWEQENETRGPTPRGRSSSAHGLAPEFKSMPTSGPGVDPAIAIKKPTAAPSSDVRDSSGVGSVCPEDDVSMDMEMTEAQTGRILGITHADDSLQCLSPTPDVYPHSGGLNKAYTTSGQKNSEALGSSNRTGMGSSLKPSLKTKLQSHQDNFDPEDDQREKTVRFSADDACMDVTRSYTVNIGNDLKLLSCRDKTMRFNVDDAGMDMTQCLTVNIANNLGSESILPVWEQESETRGPTPRGRSSSAQGLAPEFKSMPTSGPGVDPAIAIKKPTAVPSSDVRDSSGVGSVCPKDDVSMDMEMTEAQTGRILGITHADDSLQCLFPTPDLYPHSGGLNKAYTTSGQKNSEALGSSNRTGMGSSLKPSLKTKLQSHQDHFDPEDDHREKTVRFSADDACMDVTRSYTVNIGNDLKLLSCTDKTMRFNVDDAGMDMTQCLTVNIANNLGSESILPVWEQESETRGPTPRGRSSSAQGLAPEFKSLLTSNSGGLRCQDPEIARKTLTAAPSSDVRDSSGVGSICPEDDVSMDMEMTEAQTGRILGITHADDSLQFPTQDLYPHSGSLKRAEMASLLPSSEVSGSSDCKGMDKSFQTSLNTAMEKQQSHFVECDITAAPTVTAHASDCSSSIHTASVRCEATFESTFKQSLFESQLEDYASDVQKKLDDGTITVLEFFNLFNIDFVIHNPRQSVLPGRRLSDTDCTTMDVLKDRHISRPKQTVYETDVLNLTEKVEGLKVRMQDLDKPLKMVNKPLWEEIRNCSERELKSFGASLKERNNFFRKTSKAQSHEMKEVLYSNIVQANLEEQQKLRGTIEEADEMIKSLDDCICELEAELAAVGEKGFLDKPSLKSRQEEMKNVTEALADTERQTIEVELQKKHNSSKLNRLKAETRNLESHVTVLQMVNEWRFGEQSDSCTVYTFLHDTLHLQLVYEKSKGTDADTQSERKISHISFKLQLDDEKSQFHARLVHQLLSGYIEGETPWVKKYPTSRHVPKLLHDVGLVVSRCRLLGEELRLLKLWGGLRLDILDISCVDTRLHVVFSRLKTLSKFEVVFSVSLIDRLCVVEVESFHNVMGNTTIQQIKEIVASFSPAKNLVTRIVKKIHHDLLCQLYGVVGTGGVCVCNGTKKSWDFMQTHDSVSVLIFNTSSHCFVLVKQFRPAVYMCEWERSKKQKPQPAEKTEEEGGAAAAAAAAGEATAPEPQEGQSTSEGGSSSQWPPATAGLTYELCAGLVDKPDLSLEEIARQEVLEECGYDVPASKLKRITSYRSGVGVTGAKQTMFYAEVSDDNCVSAGGGEPREGELIEVVKVPLHEAMTFAYDERIPKTMGVIFSFIWFHNNMSPKYKISTNV